MREISVRYADTWDEFEKIWIEAMHHQAWYIEPNPADYQPEEEIAELKAEYGTENHVFLIAESSTGEPMGVLQFRYEEASARMGIMMPGVPLRFREYGVGHVLLQHMYQFLKERGVSRTFATSKYHDRNRCQWYFETLISSGFREREPERFQMFADLDELRPVVLRDEILLRTGENYTNEDFIEFCIRSYASTPEDLEVHGYDTSVTIPEHIATIHQKMMDGLFGESPSRMWIVAVRENAPLGYIIGFRSKQTNRSLGIIGNLGVFPEHRRQGISQVLIHALFREFQRDGLRYAMVGTPTHNTRAIDAYAKAGFREANRVQFFEKTIS